MTKEEIYGQMTGCGEYYIRDEFESGGICEKLYGEVYNARERLAERTGIDFEDADVMSIVTNLEEIAKVCSYKMYDYGVMNADKIWEERLGLIKTESNSDI